MALPDYFIRYEDLAMTEKSAEWIIRRAFTEIHQKLAMNAAVVKRMKMTHAVGDKKYKCPRCQRVVSHLTNAHVGKPMRRYLDELRIGRRQNLAYMFKRLLKRHAASHMAVVCMRCNNQLETTSASHNTS